jgi:DNA repair exonuclease SbcCD ATPase subunit
MTEITQLQQKNDRMFILISLNFTMLFILFCGLGYILWQSNRLINDLKSNLQTAEQSIAEIKDRVQQIDVDTAMDRIMTSAAGKIESSIKDALQQSELISPLQTLSEKVDNTQERLSRVSESLSEINSSLQKIDTEQLARMVSYNMLKGLGDGFSQAAESRKPDM